MHYSCLFLLALLTSFDEPPRHERLALRSATPNAAQTPCYGRFELTLDLDAAFDNPFDPDDIDVYAVFTSPEGKAIRVNGFCTVNCSRRLANNTERIELDGKPFWQIRFCPNREGVWRYRIFARDRTGTAELPRATFTVTPATFSGFVRRDARTVNAFVFDNGRWFFPIGENMCWGGPKGAYDFDQWLKRLGGSGGNWIRLWMCPWNCALEWKKNDAPPWPNAYAGAGVYHLGDAWKLDTILDAAQRSGIYVQVCLGTYGDFTTKGDFNEGMWSTNPYNAANGGPCAKPEDFWTDQRARALYRQRLRYIAARYGARPNVFAWEFWNEANAPAAWVSEMAQFLKGTGPFHGNPADPYGHLISTTYGKADVWAVPELDFTQSHHYGEGNAPDLPPAIGNDARRSREFGKPHLVAEFGIDWRKSDNEYDTQHRGTNLHNGIWSSVFSGNVGSAMIWYWDSYVDPGNLYHQYAALRGFTDRIPWAEGPWRPLEIDPPRCNEGKQPRRDLTIAALTPWGRSPDKESAVAPLDSANVKPMPTYLYGPLKPDFRQPLVLKVNYAHPGQFRVRVDSVSTLARLVFLLDGARVREVRLSLNPAKKGEPSPEYQSTTFRPEYGVYIAKFDRAYGIDVPAGSHTISLDVVEGDWLSVAEYTFAGYVDGRYPRINIMGFTNGSKAYLWAQNAEHHWLNVQNSAAIETIRTAKTVLHGLAAGRYACEWWDTEKGAPHEREIAVSAGGALPLVLPDLDTDKAVSILPISPSVTP